MRLALDKSSEDNVPYQGTIAAERLIPDRNTLVAIFATFLCGVILSFASSRIDFHADEAIYLTGVPISVKNDSGLVFHLAYLAVGQGEPTPTSARWTSLLFGIVLIFCMTRVLQLLVPGKSISLGWLTPLAMVVSYQGVFSILRVRPEISWIAMTSVACWCLAELRVHDRLRYRALLLISLLLLPMNHLLCVFSCFFLGIYLIAFARQRLGSIFCGLSIGMLGVGVSLNCLIRHWLVNGEIKWLPSLGGGGLGASGPNVDDFCLNVFWKSPMFLNDSAVAVNFWDYLLPGDQAFMSHCFVATMFWAVALLFPLAMKSWESRFVASIPLGTLVLFFASGYFNPTYSPLLSIYAVATSIFLIFQPRSKSAVRAIAFCLLVVSLVNGGSFLTTRIFNHGSATYFSTEIAMRSMLENLPEGSVVAVPERFQSIVDPNRMERFVLFKEELPADVDLIVLDNYDFEMYRFVPTYESLREQIESLLGDTLPVKQSTLPVYINDSLRNEPSNQPFASVPQGSWFFRNSMQSSISILELKPDSERFAQRDSRTTEPTR